MSNLSERTVIQKLEKSIWQIAEQNQQDDGAFYFYNEADVQCRLFSTIQENLGDSEVVHAEWCCGGKPTYYYDLVVWRKEKKRTARNYWGKGTSTLMKGVPKLILAAIEIDCLYGHDTKAKQFTTMRQLRENPDIAKLGRKISKVFSYCYFIMFWDDEACSMYRDTSKEISKQFKKLKDKNGIRSLCISREGVVFRHGFMRRR